MICICVMYEPYIIWVIVLGNQHLNEGNIGCWNLILSETSGMKNLLTIKQTNCDLC